MDETPEISEQNEAPELPPEPAPPIQSRFLFVDVAALRAKQLRRGARVRFDAEGTHKAERVAMEEVRRGLVHYNVPAPLGRGDGDASAAHAVRPAPRGAA
jgi:DNA-directed RNA polymerase omega subunit